MVSSAQHAVHDDPLPPIPVAESALRKPLDLIRLGRTDDARRELRALLAVKRDDAELHHQLARSYLADFYSQPASPQGRTSLALAMEELTATLRHDPNHIPALKAKAFSWCHVPIGFKTAASLGPSMAGPVNGRTNVPPRTS